MTVADMLDGETNVISYKVLARNTIRLSFSDGREVVKYCDTHVVTKRADHGTIVLTSGGYKTSTTKERIEANAPVRIIQHLGVWYVKKKSDNSYPRTAADRRALPLFKDGMVIDLEGDILSTIYHDDTKKTNKIRKDIAKFVKLITKDNIPIPYGGDCFYCQLHDQHGTPMGDHDGDYDHLWSHLEEGYLTGSLINNALQEDGYTPMQFALFRQMKWVEQIQRSVRKYLNRRLLKDVAPVEVE
jgi:hypothetical protein